MTPCWLFGTGTRGSLTLIACNDDRSAYQSELIVNVSAGVRLLH